MFSEISNYNKIDLKGVYQIMFKNEKELNKAFEAAKATLEIEGMTVTKEMEEVMKAKLGGKINRQQLLELADAIARREKRK